MRIFEYLEHLPGFLVFMQPIFQIFIVRYGVLQIVCKFSKLRIVRAIRIISLLSFQPSLLDFRKGLFFMLQHKESQQQKNYFQFSSNKADVFIQVNQSYFLMANYNCQIFDQLYQNIINPICIAMFRRQFSAIMAKNWQINIRMRQYLRENIAVLILSIFIIVSERTSPNQFTTPFYLGIAIAGYSRAVAVWWLTEKETHQKELQKIMGVSQFNYTITWILYFIANGLITSIVMMLIVKFLVVTDETVYAQGYGFIHIAILYVLYSISNVGFVLIMCTFFEKAKTGSQAVTFIQLIINFLYFLRFSKDLVSSQPLTMFLSIFPQLNFNMTLSNIAFIVDPSMIDYNFNISYQQGIITLIITAFAYSLLALYLDEVMPNELGTHRHPLFFIGVGYKPREQVLQEHLIDHSESQHESSAKYEQRVQRTIQPVARIINVSKSFKDHKVIDNLSLNFYESEIFCLLGHNGAGKSTTINLLTGLLSSNSGLIEIMGKNFPDDTDQIRKNIGLCLQYNVLYDNLTIEEHLKYYYRIKNTNDDLLQYEVNRIIQQCALGNERGKLAKNLSGGNKRKLCLGNSLIGGSKLIFLDEPSSGLDPNSRQSIWGILKSIQNQNRCIILTTHHLQQAQFLSKRIAIMSNGKLIIVGNKDFITDKFSVGYHVVITLNKQNPRSADISREIIRKNISRSIQDQQSAANTLKFIFPLKELPNFSKTLKELQKAKIGSISIFTSNLEDAFIKIGQEQEQFTEGFKEVDLIVNKISMDSSQESQLKTEQLKLPDVYCSYSFSKQMYAVFLRKMKTTLRSFSTVVSIIMPSGFMSIGILVVCLVIPNDETDQTKRITLDRIRLYIMSYFMVWAFVFNTSAFCGTVVLQRQKRFKYISNVSGMRQLPYWAGNYSFDLVIFYTPLIIFFIIAFSLGDNGTFVTKFAGYLVIGLILFGFSLIGYCYLFSFIYQKSNTAFRFSPFINLVFFYFLPLIPSIVNEGKGILAQYIMPLISPFVAFSSIFNTIQVVGSDFGQSGAYNKLWVCYASLFLQTVVYLASCLFLESRRFSLKTSNQEVFFQNNQMNQAYPQMNQDIVHHLQNRVSQNANFPIKVENLTKVYGNGYMAIRNNSFMVKQGEIFGLLGPNGAGKSTTFNIITAALPKTSGSVQLFNQQVNKGIMKIFSNVGVCPQYNPIYQNLTTYEHLQYFCLLKGMPKQLIRSTIDFYGQLLSLGPYMSVKAGVLSGGNKRKMCVGMAMIGNPQVVFFDQPSAGVDPISRRYLWKCLAASAKSKNTAMVLTTHSMNEAESLCSEIGILIKGQFVCLDTPKQLKQKYGHGYRINVYVNVDFQEELIKLVKRQFGEDVQVQRLEEQPEFIVFNVKNSSFCLSRAFELFEDKLARDGKIERYEIKESTLQQVFIHLSKLQPHVQEVQYAEPWQLLCWEWGGMGCTLV